MKKFLIIILILLLIASAACLFFVKDATGDAVLTEDLTLEIVEGSGTAAIAEQLYEEGLVRNAYAFRLFSRVHEVDSLYKAGTYVFKAGEWSLSDVCEALVIGGESATDAVRVTIPEGYTAMATFELLAANGLGSVEKYMEYAANGTFEAYPYIPAQADVIAPANRLEGFLFPDTYMIDVTWSEEVIVDMLLARFAEVWTSNGFDARAEELDMSVYDAVTMASIIEKEAKVAEDRPIISGVFYKRLELGWLLESCATIQFLLDEPKDILLYSDLEIESPYNTYRNAGMPPGPIAAPGMASLQAALYPEESDYLYFRARLDGSHRFSETLSEHEAYHEGDQI